MAEEEGRINDWGGAASNNMLTHDDQGVLKKKIAWELFSCVILYKIWLTSTPLLYKAIYYHSHS
ncbi:hypothetical protein TSUD_308800 [Trifolium subterraneum]|nr:hypothetical protein TSUD_308800 [Trifolium subterraneum]